jgi:hypothetical protein
LGRTRHVLALNSFGRSVAKSEQNACLRPTISGEQTRFSHERITARILLPTAVTPATARPTIRDSVYVANFGCDSVGPTQNLTPDDNPATDTRANGDHGHVLDSAPRAVSSLTPRGGVSIIFNDDRKTGGAFDYYSNWNLRPREIRCKKDCGP